MPVDKSPIALPKWAAPRIDTGVFDFTGAGDSLNRDPLSLLDFAPHAGQMQAWESQARVLLILTGTQAGKTTFLPALLYREWLERGKGDYLAASSTFPTFDTKFLPVLKDYFCRKLGWGKYKAGRGGAGVIEGNDGSRILCRMGTDPDALESGTFKGAILDEWGQKKIPVESWEAVKRRLAKEQGRAIFGTTPYTLGWLKQQVYDRAIGGDSLYEVVNFRSIDNPGYPIEEYERAKRELPDWKFQMMNNGIFTKPAGLVYGDYDDSYAEFDENWHYIGGGNLVHAFSVPPIWMRDVGVDFGKSINNALLWASEEPRTHNLFVYREISEVNQPGAFQAKAMGEYKETIRRALGGAPSEDDYRKTWNDAGFAISKPLIADLDAGVDRVVALFKTKRLFVMDHLTKLRSELGSYSRELDGAGEPTQKIEDKEKYHVLDSLRYMCSGYEVLNPIETVPEVMPQERTQAWFEQQRKQQRQKKNNSYSVWG
jgi:hypothetical protein